MATMVVSGSRTPSSKTWAEKQDLEEVGMEFYGLYIYKTKPNKYDCETMDCAMINK